jgi:L-ascorbate metabolism protein UlaG (beta-lactamase superfamily)
MELHLIRNATVKMSYAGKTLLLDPYLGEKGSGPSYTGKKHSPVVSLPVPPESVLEGVEVVVVSHAHSDHFDATAMELLPRHLPLLCQPRDEKTIRDLGFTGVRPVEGMLRMDGISFTRTPGRHGSGDVLKDMDVVSGFFFESPGEPSVYWAGDTVLTDEIRELLRARRPDVVLTHSCGAVWGEGVLILMDDKQTAEVCRLAPESVVVALHMEAVDHATVSRQQLRETARRSGIADERLLIPLDGEIIRIPARK